MCSEIKDESISENSQIDEFSINFSNEQLKNLSLITGLSSNEVREQVSYLVAALLNILTFENINLKSELESIAKIRSQFVIPDRNLQEMHENEFSETFFDDSSFVLFSLLKKDIDGLRSEVSHFFQIEKEIFSEIIHYIAPIFLNKLVQYFEIPIADFAIAYSFNPTSEIIKEHVVASDFEKNKSFLKKTEKKLATLFKKFGTAINKIVKISFVWGLFLFFGLIFFVFLYKYLLKQNDDNFVKPSITDVVENRSLLVENQKTEFSDNTSLIKQIKEEATNEIPILDPDFPEDSVEHKLIEYLRSSDKPLPSSIFKINGFKYSHGEVLFSEYLNEDIFYLSRFFKVFPNLKIALQADDNRLLSSISSLQDLYAKSFKDALLDAGVSDDQVIVEYLDSVEEVENFKVLNEFGNGVIYFRVIEK